MIPVIVRSVQLDQFMKHESSVVELPSTGAVLIQGKNGQGKSSVVDGVGWALWGKTTRSTPPYPSKDAHTVARVSLEDGVTAVREASNHRVTSLQFDTSGSEDWQVAGTPTKTQAMLDGVIGSRDIWRRTLVFKQSDTSAFAGSTDAKRKELIEAILGLDTFGEAYKRLTAQVRRIDKEIADKQREVDYLEGQRDAYVHQLKDDKAASDSPDVSALQASVAESSARLKKYRKALRLFAEESQNIRTVRDRYVVERQQLRKAQQLASGAECPTCRQPVTEKHKGALSTSEAQVTKQLDAYDAANKSVLADISRDKETYEDLVDLTTAQLEGRTRKLYRAEEAAEAAAGRNRRLQDAHAHLEGLKRDIAALATEIEALEADRDTYKVAADVCGTKGVRAHLLSDALKGVTTIANSWLAEFKGHDLRINLAPRRQKADGSMADEIDLQVEGAGGDYGYAACSTGQQKRIDVALLIGLAQVAGSSQGVQGSTLWLDEVFDGLDDDGLDSIGHMVNELAAKRPVVIISHKREALMSVVNFERIYTVADFKVTRTL